MASLQPGIGQSKASGKRNVTTDVDKVVGEIKRVRKHGSNLIFLTVQPVSKNTDKNSSDSSLQIAICPKDDKKLERMYKTQRKILKPHAKISAAGFYGYTRSNTRTFFVNSFQVVKLLPGIAPAVLWLLLQAVEENSIEMKLACSMLDEKLENLESILALKKREKKQWCSSKAREITIGRARRGRVKAPTLSKFHKGVLEKYTKMLSRDMNTHSSLVLEEIIINESYIESADPLGNVDPANNLKHFIVPTTMERDLITYATTAGRVSAGLDARMHYAVSKKRPQVQCLIRIIRENILPRDNQVIIDVGGGRGDLGLALAVSFPRQRVIVLEPNVPSLKAGEFRAKELGIKNIGFDSKKLNDLKINEYHSRCETYDGSTQENPPIVVGLHCCGGLSDAILDLCGRQKLAFCVVTCCFKSFPELRPVEVCESKEDYDALARLAETNDFKDFEIQHRAMSIINNLRVQKHIFGHGRRERTRSECDATRTWTFVKLYRFPRQWSKRNYVLCGKYS